MTNTQLQILDLFRSLKPSEQRELAERLSAQTTSAQFYERMTAAQLAELEQAIVEADRNEGSPVADVFDRLTAKYAVKSSK